MATDLFTPIRLGGLKLPNRIVMAPLTRNRAGPGGREQGYTDYPALTDDPVAPLRLSAAPVLRRGVCLAPLSQLGPIPTWREPA